MNRVHRWSHERAGKFPAEAELPDDTLHDTFSSVPEAPMREDTTALLLAAAGGDRVALAAFVRATQPDVWRFCAYLVDRDAADDLTQEVYLRALGAMGRFRGDSSARTWLMTIARRTCADALRKRYRRRRAAATDAATIEPSSSGLVELELLLGQLDEDRHTAFVLTQVLGFSYAEAAACCEVPVGTIRSRVSRAREDLVALLADGDVAAAG